MKPLAITLPHPILPGTLEATLYKEDLFVNIAVEKALKELWPEDVFHGQQLRWDVDKLKPWTVADSLKFHIFSQFQSGHFTEPEKDVDVLIGVRKAIRWLFYMVLEGRQRFRIRNQMEGRSTEWFIRAHLPILTSPQGSPLLLLTAVDQRLAFRLVNQGKLNEDQLLDNFCRVFYDPEAADGRGEKEMATMWLRTAEEVYLFRYFLRLNFARIRASAWQRKNLPRDGLNPAVFLATFLRPLYRDEGVDEENMAGMPEKVEIKWCGLCFKTDPNLQGCARCKAVSYCSRECQKADWKKHKLTCVQA